MSELLDLLEGKGEQKKEKKEKIKKEKKEAKQVKPKKKKTTVVEKGEIPEDEKPKKRHFTEKQAEKMIKKVLAELGIDKPIENIVHDLITIQRSRETTLPRKIGRIEILDLFQAEKRTNPRLKWYRHKSHGKGKKYPFSDELDWIMEHFDIIEKQSE